MIVMERMAADVSRGEPLGRSGGDRRFESSESDGAAIAGSGRTWRSSLRRGDRVIPESMGGSWIDRSVCEACNAEANKNADSLISRDLLTRYADTARS
jgi:hypothetical protein